MKALENLYVDAVSKEQLNEQEKKLQQKTSATNRESNQGMNSFAKAPVIIDMRKKKNLDLM